MSAHPLQPSREEYVVKPETMTPCCSVRVAVKGTVEKRCPGCRNIWRLEVGPAGPMQRLLWTLRN
jgi:hypothetical protein